MKDNGRIRKFNYDLFYEIDDFELSFIFISFRIFVIKN